MRQLIAFLLLLISLSNASGSTESETLFAQHRNSVFQIKLIDNGSNQKKSLGSGFRVGGSGIVATNYHVISDIVYEENNYRIEVLDDKNVLHRATLRAIDIVHDLALLELNTNNNMPPHEAAPLTINTDTMLQGTSVYSLGNPHDLGMMIVAGEYNGAVKDSRFKRMIFSGDINSGMSGGPAINAKGELVGINVASSGGGLGYLVPAFFLIKLLEDLPQQATIPLTEIAGKQLTADQDEFYSSLMATEWPSQPFADLVVPQELDRSIKCWGKSDDASKRRYDTSTLSCSNNSDYHFIMSGKYLGFIEYRYSWFKELDLNRFQLYSLVGNNFKFEGYAFDNYEESWSKDDVTPYTCKTSFIDSGGGTWRTVYCVRHYKIFPGLFDVGLLMTSADSNNKNLSMEMTAAGISESKALQLTEKFIRSVSWKK